MTQEKPEDKEGHRAPEESRKEVLENGKVPGGAELPLLRGSSPGRRTPG